MCKVIISLAAAAAVTGGAAAAAPDLAQAAPAHAPAHVALAKPTGPCGGCKF